MKRFEKPWVHTSLLLILFSIVAINASMASSTEVEKKASAEETVGLIGEWCHERKRRVTKYSVKEGTLRIRSGRSGQLHEADLTCNDAYTECQAKTIRGWGTPVTETLRLDGETMKLTRVWGGAWKDKTYNFVFTRCPKW